MKSNWSLAKAATISPQAGKVRILWLDRGCLDPKEFRNLLAAIAHARSVGESASFHQGDLALACWDPIGGYKLFVSSDVGGGRGNTNAAGSRL